MKKTLIALAVLAASGASFAQVTLTGNVGFGFQKSASQTDSNNNNGSGMAVVDGTINFTAREDLGDGMSIIASTEVQLRGRSDAAPAASLNGNQFRPRNATLAMITRVGVFSMGAIESPSGFFRTTSYGDNFQSGLDGANGPWDGKANIDFVRYLVPISALPGLQLSAWYTEVGAGVGNSFAPNVLNTKITAPVLMVNYAAGPITAYADYTMFSAQKTPAAMASPASSVFDGLNRYRIGGDYNFGIAKVSLGYQTRDHDLADQYAFGLTVPLGAITMNLTYGARDSQKAVAKYGVPADVERTGTALQVKYSFSKTAFAEVNYATYTGGGFVAAPGNFRERDYSDEYRIRLNKSF
ncbi:MAG: porin [Candidatus Saccharibacteria bacterium]|nr:porin [Rhodoferax sp.]